MFYTRCYVALMIMFSRKVNKLSKEDVVVIMNMFDSVETITYIGDDKYQIRLNKAEY